MMREKFIKGNYYKYEGVDAYAVSLNRLITVNGLVVTRSNKPLIGDSHTYGGNDKAGYKRVKIDGAYTMVHRLVATYFIPNPDNLPVVDHINENKEDNRVINLRWVTLQDNTSFINKRENKDLDLIREERSKVKAMLDENTKLLLVITEETDKLHNAVNSFNLLEKKLVTELTDLVDRKLEPVIRELSTLKEYRRRSAVNTITSLKKNVEGKVTAATYMGNPVKVNGTVFPSMRAAASFVTSSELLHGERKNVDTVKKEIKRMMTGETSFRTLYGKYEVSSV
jgi:hypothetical protein